MARIIWRLTKEDTLITIYDKDDSKEIIKDDLVYRIDDKSIAEQWRAILRKTFDRWHDRTLKRVEKILGIKNE